MVQGAIAGLAVGGLYAVIAVCMTLMVRLTRVVNFAIPACGMAGTYSALPVVDRGAPLWLAVLVGVLVGAVLSALIGVVSARWLGDADINRRSAVTVAMLLFFIAAAFIIFGNKPKTFDALVEGPAFTAGNVVVTRVSVLMTAAAVLLVALSYAALAYTRLGTTLRALSERPVTAELLGVPVTGLSVGVWAVVGAVATLAVAIVAPTQTSDPLALSLLVIPASAAALLGGFQHSWQALVGGLLLGAIQGMLAQFATVGVLRDWLALIVIVAFLMWTQRGAVWDAAR